MTATIREAEEAIEWLLETIEGPLWVEGSGGGERSIREPRQEASWMSGRGGSGRTRPGTRRPGQRPYSSFWLVVAEGEKRAEALTLGLPDGGGALALFCHPQEAEMLLRFEARRGWRSAEASAREPVPVLLGPCSGVGCVPLDPSPAILTGGLLGLVTVGRERFLNRLV